MVSHRTKFLGNSVLFVLRHFRLILFYILVFASLCRIDKHWIPSTFNTIMNTWLFGTRNHMPCKECSSMIRHLEGLSCLSHCRMNGPDIAATDQNVETQVAGAGVCVVGSVAEWRARACPGVSRECGRWVEWHGVAGEGVPWCVAKWQARA